MVNLGVSNEVGIGGGAILVQNAVHSYAAKYAAREYVVRQWSVSPTLLVEFSGPNMNLSEVVFSDVIVFDQWCCCCGNHTVH